MRKLTIKEKAEAYERAIARAKEQAIDGYLDAVALNDIFPELKEGEQKPVEWSKENENLFKLSLENLTELKDRFGEEYGKVGDCIVFLESIKDRYTWKPSDGQMQVLEFISDYHAFANKNNQVIFNEFVKQLKKLREE